MASLEDALAQYLQLKMPDAEQMRVDRLASPVSITGGVENRMVGDL